MKLENTLKGIHNRLDDVEQRIYKVEDRVGKNNEVELKRKGKKKKIKKTRAVKQTTETTCIVFMNVHSIRIPKEGEIERDREHI